MIGRVGTQILYPLLGVVVLIAMWWLLCLYFRVPTVVLPTPDKVVHALTTRIDLILEEGWVTLKETILGFVLAIVIGIPMAVLVANSRPINLIVSPLLIGAAGTARIYIAPRSLAARLSRFISSTFRVEW